MKNCFQNVAFDLDGTLFRTGDFYKAVIERVCNCKVIENGKFKWDTFPEITEFEACAAFRVAFKHIDKLKPYEGAIELLTKLYERTGHPPLIVTARPRWAANDTYRLLDRYMKKIPYQVVFVDCSTHKSTHLHNVENFVDDRRKTALELVDAGKYIFMPDREYNQIAEDVPNLEVIDSVADLIPMISSLVKYEMRLA